MARLRAFLIAEALEASRLPSAPDDVGLWTSATGAAFIARRLGLEKIPALRGLEDLRRADP